MRHRRQIANLDLTAVEPFLIRVCARELGLDFGVGYDATLLQVDKQHLARLEPPFADDLFFRDRQDAAFRRHNDEVVVGHQIARRPQAVAIEGGADLTAVGKCHRGRTVPGLHQCRVIFVESAPGRIHKRVAGPGFRDQHHRRMRKRIAALNEEFESIVEAGRIRLAFV